MPRKITPPFHADHVGSFLRPEKLKQAREDAGFALGANRHERQPDAKMGLEDLKTIEDSCIRELVKFQESVGLQSITDGEYRRGSWAYDLLGSIDGIELKRPQAGKDATFTSGAQPPVAHAVGKVTRPAGGLVMSDFRFLKTCTDRTVKVTMPSPTMMILRGGRDAIDATVYPDLEEYFDDITGVYRQEIAALAAEGSTYVQIDNTDAAYICDPKFQEKSRAQGMEPEEQMRLQGRLISAATRDRPDNLAVSMHVCRGNSAGAWVASGGYEAIGEILFSGFDVDAFFLEFDSERAGDFSPLRHATGDQLIVLGLVTTKTPENYSKDDLLARIDEASKFVSVDSLALSPQCGFASVARGNPISIDDQRRKLDLIQEVAHEVWGET